MLRKLIREWPDRNMGVVVPRLWGKAWDDPSLRMIYLAPIPLNFLIGWALTIYYRLRSGPQSRYLERLKVKSEEDWHSGFNLGYQDGFKEGEAAGLRRIAALKDELVELVKKGP